MVPIIAKRGHENVARKHPASRKPVENHLRDSGQVGIAERSEADVAQSDYRVTVFDVVGTGEGTPEWAIRDERKYSAKRHGPASDGKDARCEYLPAPLTGGSHLPLP